MKSEKKKKKKNGNWNLHNCITKFWKIEMEYFIEWVSDDKRGLQATDDTNVKRLEKKSRL